MSTTEDIKPADTQDVNADNRVEWTILHNQLVAQELERFRAQREAVRRLDAEDEGSAIDDRVRRKILEDKAQTAYRRIVEPPAPPFDAGTLGEILARPADPPMRVQGLIPSDASALLVAQRKTGKTTLILNWASALVFGTPLLGTLDTRPIDGTVALLNFEVSAATLARWADDQGIPHDRLVVVNLRGRRNPLSHLDDRKQLAEYLRTHDVEALAVDPFGRAYSGTSQNDSGEVGKFLTDLDAFVRSEVGATDLLLAAHAGWNGERTRGASALEDWADVIITMTRDADDETQRFVRAIGRDVELDEDRLDFDPASRTLALSGTGSRAKVKADGKLADLAVCVRRATLDGPVTGRTVLENLIRAMDDAPSFRHGEVAKAAELAARQGLLAIENLGAGRPKVYRALDPGVKAA